VLRVGVVPGPSARVVYDTLLELGAVPAAGPTAPPATEDPGTIAVAIDGQVASVHLAVEAVDPTSPARAAADRAADVVIEGWSSRRELLADVDALWAERLVPFEQHLSAGRRAPRRHVPVLVGPDPAWAGQAARLVDRLRVAVGGLALRIDHIGSTSVPGLRAKDLIDIQVAVRDLEDAAAAADAARRAGFVHVAGSWSGEDRSGAAHPEEVAVDADPGRPTNVNCRPVTAPVWRDALLFRDWLRSHPDERAAYEAMKVRLSEAAGAHVDRYGEEKMPWIRAGLERAEAWAAGTGWAP
jgi:dephospho-CoA kinase